MLAARGLLDPAARELQSLVLAAPRRAEVRFALAFVALARDEPETAARAADEALALRRPYPEARLVRAEALLRGGHDAEARPELERFLGEAPARMASERARAQEILRGAPGSRPGAAEAPSPKTAIEAWSWTRIPR